MLPNFADSSLKCMANKLINPKRLSPKKIGPCAVKKLLKINHENTKVRKHETRHRNELSRLRRDLESCGHRFAQIYTDNIIVHKFENLKICVHPCPKRKFIYYHVANILFGISCFRDNSFLFRVLHNLTCNRTGWKNSLSWSMQQRHRWKFAQ